MQTAETPTIAQQFLLSLLADMRQAWGKDNVDTQLALPPLENITDLLTDKQCKIHQRVLDAKFESEQAEALCLYQTAEAELAKMKHEMYALLCSLCDDAEAVTGTPEPPS